MSQTDLAKAIGIKQPSMADIESGKSKSPNGINLLKIAAVLEANPWWIATGEGPEHVLQEADEEEARAAFRELSPEKRAAILAAMKAIK